MDGDYPQVACNITPKLKLPIILNVSMAVSRVDPNLVKASLRNDNL